MSELERQVREIIRDVYCADYNHRLEVIKQEGDEYNPTQYALHLYIHQLRLAPMCIAIQCDTDEEFLLYVRKELESRNLIRSDFYKIQLHGSN